MKKFFIFLLTLFSSVTLIACNNKTEEKASADSKYLTGEYGLAKNVQDGVILHAWNWSYDTIKDNLLNIAEAGFTTVQTSPVQQPKSYNGSSSVMNTWWKLYQPVSFTVGDGWLGDKTDLTELCSEAEKYGIKIICDIVVNHMANITDFEGYYPEIEEYEPEIYKNPTKYFHPYEKDGEEFGTSDSNVEYLTQGSLSGLPDLNTKEEHIQERVRSLLKECVDCGVSGFRFDAAKHIETPDDKEFASNFWPNVLDPTTSYAKETYNRDMYYYGEILGTPGAGRKMSSYTKYMSVTDSGLSGNIHNRASSKNTDLLIKCFENYSYDLTAEKAVLWVESHDTYASSVGSSNLLKDNSPKLSRSWSIVANRYGATALYFARPGSAGMGECGTNYWMSQEVTAVNQFHNAFINASESFTMSKGFLVGERYREEDGKTGVILTNIENSTSDTKVKDVKVNKLSDGTYYDQITGNEFTVVDGKVSGTMSKTGIVVLYDKEVSIKPLITATQSAKYIYEGGEGTLTLNVSNAQSVSYKINDGEKVDIEADGVIKVNTAAKVTVYATGDKEVSQTFEFKTVEKREGYWCVAGINPSTLEEKSVYAWVWGNGADGGWRTVEVIDGVAYVAQQPKDYGMLLAFFDKGLELKDLSWNLSPTQTDDFGKSLDDNVVYFAGV